MLGSKQLKSNKLINENVLFFDFKVASFRLFFWPNFFDIYLNFETFYDKLDYTIFLKFLTKKNICWYTRFASAVKTVLYLPLLYLVKILANKLTNCKKKNHDIKIKFLLFCSIHISVSNFPFK